MKEIQGLALAGGNSSRFGSNKALALFDGMTMLGYSLNLLTSAGLEACISGPQELKASFADHLFIPDLYLGQGPLAGLHSALTQLNVPVLALTCDMPNLDIALLFRLLDEFRSCAASMIVYQTEAEWVQPFPGVYTPELLPLIERLLKDGQLSLQTLAQDSLVKTIPCTQKDAFLNRNTP